MKFVNEKEFERKMKLIVRETLAFRFNVWQEDIINQYCNTGLHQFEVSGIYTKTGNPELIDFEVEIREISEDEFETTIIF